MINRRKETRYRVRDGVFAIDTHEPQRLGEVIDISREGIAFRYMDGPNDLCPSTKLNIFSSTHSLFLSDYNFKNVSDIQIEGHPSSAIHMRRYGGKFIDLTPQQQEQLDDFINLHSLYPG
jgi:c-di-GMP-binding flagellar brake protein YcgR